VHSKSVTASEHPPSSLFAVLVTREYLFTARELSCGWLPGAGIWEGLFDLFRKDRANYLVKRQSDCNSYRHQV
jgi:hypothetical protein